MHNELLHIGPLTVYGYGFMIAMGVLAAWFVDLHLRRFCSGSPTGGNFCRIQGRS